MDTKKRINIAKSINIGNHVWVAQDAVILKGTSILDDSVVGMKAIVTKRMSESNVVLAGNPARIVRRQINWDRYNLEGI